MIRISKKQASEQLRVLKESYGVDPIYIDEKAAKAFECLELFINQTLLDRNPLKKEEKDENVTSSEITKIEEDIRKSAERMKEYKQTGNYEQEALEHQDQNDVVYK